MNWKIKGGPKNNGRFAHWRDGKLYFGRSHRPMTKIERLRFFRVSDDQERRLGWCKFYTLAARREWKEAMPQSLPFEDQQPEHLWFSVPMPENWSIGTILYTDTDKMFRDMGIE